MSGPGMLVNGERAERVSVLDRGFSYGDGVFRTLRCESGQLLYWQRQWQRLAADCAGLGIACPPENVWRADIACLAPGDAVVKLTVTRGVSGRGYACGPEAVPTRVVQVSPLPVYPATLATEGVVVRRCATLLSLQPGLAGMKHLNRLDQVMARREWQDPAVFEGLMSNPRGELVSGVMSNLFLVKAGMLCTHPLQDCGVAGVSRSVLLALAQGLGLPVREVPLYPADLELADEVFLTNSLFGVVPVRQCGALCWSTFPVQAQLRSGWLAWAQAEAVSVTAAQVR